MYNLSELNIKTNTTLTQEKCKVHTIPIRHRLALLSIKGHRVDGAAAARRGHDGLGGDAELLSDTVDADVSFSSFAFPLKFSSRLIWRAVLLGKGRVAHAMLYRSVVVREGREGKVG